MPHPLERTLYYNSDLHNKVRDAVLARFELSKRKMAERHVVWDRASPHKPAGWKEPGMSALRQWCNLQDWGRLLGRTMNYQHGVWWWCSDQPKLGKA